MKTKPHCAIGWYGNVSDEGSGRWKHFLFDIDVFGWERSSSNRLVLQTAKDSVMHA